jgi:chemotaxis protein methyltransferase WspC
VKFTEVENLLSTRIGFDIHTVGPQAIESGCRQSMEEAGVSDPTAYARMLAGDPDAWNRLLDRVVIPETWFFRDIAPFELAANLAREHVSRASDRVLRILSCPCSTGEEPYSLVMAILHAGVPPESFIVDAVDVSRRALESAQVAEFRIRSFREKALWFRSHYFDHAEGGGLWHLKDSVASLVRFRHGNLIAPDFLEDDGPYDIVFCRNLLIYLHAEARLLALTALRRLVGEGGVLVVGHAEAAFARENGFTLTGAAAAFAFSNPGARVVTIQQPRSGQNMTSKVPPRPPAAASRVAPLSSVTPAAPTNRAALPPQEPETSLLIIARRFGDSGQLNEALRVCGEYLQLVPDSAEGHFLQGVLHDALGHVELAVASFRKALYLDPTHREALLHLALKQEARGDGSGAALLRARARRAEDLSVTE